MFESTFRQQFCYQKTLKYTIASNLSNNTRLRTIKWWNVATKMDVVFFELFFVIATTKIYLKCLRIRNSVKIQCANAEYPSKATLIDNLRNNRRKKYISKRKLHTKMRKIITYYDWTCLIKCTNTSRNAYCLYRERERKRGNEMRTPYEM